MKKIFLFLKSGFWTLLCIGLLSSCKKYLELPRPANSIEAAGAYGSDASLGILINGALQYIIPSLTGPSGGNISLALYVDELEPNVDPTGLGEVAPSPTEIFSWKITPSNISYKYWWSKFYSMIYTSNAVIENVPKQSTLQNKNQWLGEAYFLRALAYFYLVNIYGNVALITATDYKENSKLPRVAPEQAYKLIQADLQQAINLLSSSYKDVNGINTTDRSRPNQLVAKALLARISLYTNQWEQAWNNADQLIKDTRYQLQPKATIENTFLATSRELILGTDCDEDYAMYNVSPSTMFMIPPARLSGTLLNAFEPNDLRKKNWTKDVSVLLLGQTISLPSKFKSALDGKKKLDRLPLLRLAEQYLIRAEAATQLAKQGDASKLAGAIADLNIIRLRAGLGVTTAATPDAVLDAIAQERRMEFFGEGGQRFFDLRRTKKLDALMKIEMETSRLGTGAKWESYKQYLPITLEDNKAGLAQTPGY